MPRIRSRAAALLLLGTLVTRVLAQPLAHTYSIVARDPATGEMGVAVQSHWFSVGSIVTWAEAGVGAIATQSFVDPGYGHRGLELMRRGISAPDALQQLVARDAERDGRQVAMIDARGRVSAYTGSSAIFTAVFAKEPIRAELLDRLPAAGLFPKDPQLMQRMQALKPRP